jgi:phytoene dehydrogenase-like protein
LRELPTARAILFDLSPWQLSRIAGDLLPPHYRRRLEHFKHAPGVFKIDYALNGLIPWEAEECRHAGTVHLGGTLEEIALAERQVTTGKAPACPFVLVAQQTIFDKTRAPKNHHTLWTYCHTPHGSLLDMVERIEGQIERFAPGFRNRILARHVTGPAGLEKSNGNLIGGDISGGASNLRQLIARPVLSPVPYRTPLRGIYLCSSSTPPGGGVHGMCGFHAARAALRDLFV